MESAQNPGVDIDLTRIRVVMGKFPVVQVKQVGAMWHATLDWGNSVHSTMKLPFKPDLREGDLLTVYTEMLSCQPSTS